MMEQIAELKAEVASELRAQEELKKQHDRALAEQQAILDDERRARQEEQQQNAAALAAAAAQARAEALARQAADGRADCAGVMESLINGVENSVKIKQFREQLVSPAPDERKRTHACACIIAYARHYHYRLGWVASCHADAHMAMCFLCVLRVCRRSM
jgi:hypothetical protein